MSSHFKPIVQYGSSQHSSRFLSVNLLEDNLQARHPIIDISCRCESIVYIDHVPRRSVPAKRKSVYGLIGSTATHGLPAEYDNYNEYRLAISEANSRIPFPELNAAKEFAEKFKPNPLVFHFTGAW